MLPGIYKAVGVASWLAESSKKKTPYVNIKFVLPTENNATGFVPVWISDAAIGMARRALKAFSFDIDKESVYTLANGSKRLEGIEFEVEAVEEEYKGEPRIKFQMPMGDAPLTQEGAAKVDAMLRSKSEEKPKRTVRKQSESEAEMERQLAKPTEDDPDKLF